MSTIIVIESRPWIRQGILQATAQAAPGWRIDGSAYLDMPVEPWREQGYELMLLSVLDLDDVHQAVTMARLTYMPKAILLLVSSRGVAPWANGLPAGVVGCVPTDAPAEMLQASIRLVLAGGMFFPAQGIGRRGAEHLDAPCQPAADADAACTAPRELQFMHHEGQALGLTPRQYEVLVLLARGYTLKAIGRDLNIAVTTAKVHAETVYQRLHVHNRTEAVYAAISRGATLGWPAMAREAAVSV